ncbi:MAG: hypothetical protein JKY65_05840 [Planctomycetes bacterium]|nr:hypothetical protein [Planctomycetota bacterium]
MIGTIVSGLVIVVVVLVSMQDNIDDDSGGTGRIPGTKIRGNFRGK